VTRFRSSVAAARRSANDASDAYTAADALGSRVHTSDDIGVELKGVR
jgi:hypothetical protein